MKNKLNHPLFLIGFGISFYVLLMNLEKLPAMLKGLADFAMPVIVGLLTAFVLLTPVNGFERLICRMFTGRKRKPQPKLLHLVSLLLTLICVIAVLVVLFALVIPQVTKATKSVIDLIDQNWPVWLQWLESYGINTELLGSWAGSMDLRQYIEKAINNLSSLVGSVASVASSTVSVAVDISLGFVMAIYILLSRDALALQAKKLLYANCSKKAADWICEVCLLIRDTYASFFSGQCLEALILGSLICIAFLIFGLPYAWMVGMVTAICALIPYVGAFLSCALAVLLALLVSPTQALLCFVVYMGVQFVENQFIYPHVVGGSVGLSPLWTLVAVLLGGKLFGVIGMILFIPLMAVIYELIRQQTNRKLMQKGIRLDDTGEE